MKSGLVVGCPEQLRATNYNQLELEGCYSKYKKNTDTTFSLGCPTPDKSEVWEEDIGKPPAERGRKIACLNLRCCALTANLKIIWFFRLGLVLFLLAILSFVLSAACLYLSFKSFLGTTAINYRVDYAYFFLFAIVFLVSVVLFFSLSLGVLKEKKILLGITEKETTLKRDNDLYFALNEKPLLYQHLNKMVCYPLERLLEKKKVKHILSSDCQPGLLCNKNSIRLGMRISNGAFMIKQSYNDPTVKRFGSDYERVYFPDFAETNEDFFSIEGPTNLVKEIFSSELKFCPANANDQRPKLDILYEFLYRDYKPKNSTRKTSQHLNIEGSKSLNQTLSSQGSLAVEHSGVKARKSVYDNKAHRQEEKLEANHRIDALFKWRDIDIIIKNQATGEPVHGAWIKIFEDKQICDKSIEKKQEMLYGVSIANGSFRAYNLIKKLYTVVSGRKGFKVNCESLYLDSFSYNNFYLALTPEIESQASLKAILYWNQPQLNLQLTARFEHNQIEECRVGFFNPTCGATVLNTNEVQSYSANNLTQSITIQRLGQYVYSFSVVQEPNDDKRQALMELSMQGFENNTANNSLYKSSNVVVKLFVREKPYPVAEFLKPDLAEADNGKPGKKKLFNFFNFILIFFFS
jgi:hypothetical protein